MNEYISEDIWIQGRFRRIAATYTLPAGKKDIPFVVMLHGTGSCRHEVYDGYRVLSRRLAENGIASIRFDFAGCGDSPVDYSEYTMKSALEDTQDIVTWIRAREEINPERFGLIGWSQGAMLAVMRAGTDEKVKSLVTWACALKMNDFWIEHKAKALRDGIVRIECDWRPPMNVSAEWFREAETTDAAEYLPGYHGAVFAVCGSRDEYHFDRNSPVIVEKCAGTDKLQWLVPDGNHIFNIDSGNTTLFDEVVERTVCRFATTL